MSDLVNPLNWIGAARDYPVRVNLKPKLKALGRIDEVLKPWLTFKVLELMMMMMIGKRHSRCAKLIDNQPSLLDELIESGKGQIGIRRDHSNRSMMATQHLMLCDDIIQL